MTGKGNYFFSEKEVVFSKMNKQQHDIANDL